MYCIVTYNKTTDERKVHIANINTLAEAEKIVDSFESEIPRWAGESMNEYWHHTKPVIEYV